MPFIGNKPSAVPLTSADIADGIITSAKIADGTIVNADINVSSAIALSKLSTTGTADATTFLRGDGAYTAVSSDFVLLASTDASSSASVSFDGYFSSTYKNYKVIISNAIPATNNVLLRIRFRRSNADITTANYRGIVDGAYSNSGGSSMGANWYYNATSMSDALAGTLNNTTIWGGLMMEMNLYNPLNTNNYKYVTYQTGYINYDATQWYINNGTGFLTDNASTLSGITFFMQTGNIASGNFKLYGIK